MFFVFTSRNYVISRKNKVVKLLIHYHWDFNQMNFKLLQLEVIYIYNYFDSTIAAQKTRIEELHAWP